MRWGIYNHGNGPDRERRRREKNILISKIFAFVFKVKEASARELLIYTSIRRGGGRRRGISFVWKGACVLSQCRRRLLFPRWRGGGRLKKEEEWSKEERNSPPYLAFTWRVGHVDRISSFRSLLFTPPPPPTPPSSSLARGCCRCCPLKLQPGPHSYPAATFFPPRAHFSNPPPTVLSLKTPAAVAAREEKESLKSGRYHHLASSTHSSATIIISLISLLSNLLLPLFCDTTVIDLDWVYPRNSLPKLYDRNFKIFSPQTPWKFFLIPSTKNHESVNKKTAFFPHAVTLPLMQKVTPSLPRRIYSAVAAQGHAVVGYEGKKKKKLEHKDTEGTRNRRGPLVTPWSFYVNQKKKRACASGRSSSYFRRF